jgi:hypothetical protein
MTGSPSPAFSVSRTTPTIANVSFATEKGASRRRGSRTVRPSGGAPSSRRRTKRSLTSAIGCR